MPQIDFTPKTKRVRLRVHKTDLIRHGTDSRTQTLDVSIVLTEGDDTMTGMPEWIQDPYAAMLKEKSVQGVLKFTHSFANMAIEIFPTPKGKRNFPPVIDAELKSFQMERVGKAESAQVAIYFTIKFPARKEIFDWTWEHKGMDCYATFEQQQRKLDMHPKPGEGVDDDDQDDGDDATPPPPKTLPFDSPERKAILAANAEDRKARNAKADEIVKETQAKTRQSLTLSRKPN